MFSILSNKLTYGDLKTSIENARQTRPFEIIRTGSTSNIKLKRGYKGNTILNDAYNFSNRLFDTFIALKPGDRILLCGQTNLIENGIWDVMSIIDGFTNIQRPDDYNKNTPIRSGQYVLIIEGETLSGKIYKNITPEYDSNGNKIVAYNGTYDQTWKDYRYIGISLIKLADKVTFYTDRFYQGNSLSLSLGLYPNLNLNFPNISSIKIPAGFKVEVRDISDVLQPGVTDEHKLILFSDVPNLNDYLRRENTGGFPITWEDAIRSCIISAADTE